MVSQNDINNNIQDNDFSVNRATAGTTVQSSVDHSDNTSGTSNSKFLAQVGGTSGGDPHLNINVSGVQDYALGIDNSDSDHLKLTDGANPSAGSTYLTCDQASTNIWLDGISFNSGTDVLDYYEEGTWTPGLTFGGGSTGMTFSSRNGAYTRIGRVVYCSFDFILSAKGSSTGNAQLTTLPFTSYSGANFASPSIRQQLITFAASYYSVELVVEISASTALIRASGDNNNLVTLTQTAFGNTSGLAGQFYYLV